MHNITDSIKVLSKHTLSPGKALANYVGTSTSHRWTTTQACPRRTKKSYLALQCRLHANFQRATTALSSPRLFCFRWEKAGTTTHKCPFLKTFQEYSFCLIVASRFQPVCSNCKRFCPHTPKKPKISVMSEETDWW
ncbi:hypothetical protein BaRGS_00019860 [Batillaria attramentaria]|uniref:Uncharacterized protein n=1 Tax=Batillaria attramentaria TaxID=370345 RepID=A0ABD0KNS9_9CAEN